MNRVFREWVTFHQANPSVFGYIQRFAEQAIATGRKRFSVYTIGHRVRWYVDIDTISSDGFKLNNNHLPFYARLVVLLNGDKFKGFFQVRGGRWVDQVTDDQLLDAYHGRGPDNQRTLF